MGNFNQNPETSGSRFDREGSGRFGRRDSNRSYRHDSRPADFYEVICNKCDNKFEVSFRPKDGRPVYCSDCVKNHQ